MSVEAIAAVLNHSRAKGTTKLVLLGIANHAGDGGAWPTVSTLARYANVTERNVQKAIDQLVKLGELARYQQAGGRPGQHPWERPNRYDVLVSCPMTCDRSLQHRLRDLPRAPAQLWADPVSDSTPGVGSDTRPLSAATPDPVSGATPKPPLEPAQPTEVRTVTTGARPVLCTVCSLPRIDCDRRSDVSGHKFEPPNPNRALTDVKARAELHKELAS